MIVAFLTGDPALDVSQDRAIWIDGTAGRLAVADAAEGGEVRSSVAVAFPLGRDGVGYMVVALFPPGEWGSEEADSLRVVASFRTEVPPGLRAFPVGASED